MTVEWPSGIRDVLFNTDIRRRITITEGSTGSPAILVSIDSVKTFASDTLVVPVNLFLPSDVSLSSVEMSLSGFQGQLEFIDVTLESSLMGEPGGANK